MLCCFDGSVTSAPYAARAALCRPSAPVLSQSPGTWTPIPEHLFTALILSCIASQVFLVCVVLLPTSLTSPLGFCHCLQQMQSFPLPTSQFPGTLIPICTRCCYTAHLRGSSGRLPGCQPVVLGYLTLVSLEALELCRRWSKHP